MLSAACNPRIPGNLTDDGEKYEYVYNPFGQLVKILDRSTDNPVAIYTYNGLGQRISEQLDCNDSSDTGTPDGVVDGYDPVFYIALDQHGRRIATYRGTDSYPKETFIWHPMGLGGPALRAGGLILRDRNDSLSDPTQWALEEATDTRAERRYSCSDFRGDVVALVEPTGLETGGMISQQVRYTATGIPIGIPLGDVTGDGVVDGSPDEEIIAALYAGEDYEVRADLNLDGVVDSADVDICDGQVGVEAGRGHLSAPAVGSRVGYRNMEAFGEGFGVMWFGAGLTSAINASVPIHYSAHAGLSSPTTIRSEVATQVAMLWDNISDLLNSIINTPITPPTTIVPACAGTPCTVIYGFQCNVRWMAGGPGFGTSCEAELRQRHQSNLTFEELLQNAVCSQVVSPGVPPETQCASPCYCAKRSLPITVPGPSGGRLRGPLDPLDTPPCANPVLVTISTSPQCTFNVWVCYSSTYQMESGTCTWRPRSTTYPFLPGGPILWPSMQPQ